MSLVRLVYDMAASKQSLPLNLISTWSVLSVGIIDAAVYVSPDPSIYRLINTDGEE